MRRAMIRLKDTGFYRHVISAILHPRNFIFVKKYPFWASRNAWTGRFIGYEVTEYDNIPKGWQKAFGKQLTADIAAALKADGIRKKDWRKNLRWEQIKEKWGTLRLYAATTERVQHVLDRYECMSYCFCIDCGKPARYVTCGYVSYICDDCHDNGGEYNKRAERLTAYDLPHYYSYANGVETERTALEKYGIDIAKAWGLKGDDDGQ